MEVSWWVLVIALTFTNTQPTDGKIIVGDVHYESPESCEKDLRWHMDWLRGDLVEPDGMCFEIIQREEP